MVSRAREVVRKRGTIVRVGGKRIEGAREKKIGALEEVRIVTSRPS